MMGIDPSDDGRAGADDGPQLQWGVKALWAQLEPLLPGLSVEVVAGCVSTSTELLERARRQRLGASIVPRQSAWPQRHSKRFFSLAVWRPS